MSARALCEGREGAGGLQVPHKEWTTESRVVQEVCQV